MCGVMEVGKKSKGGNTVEIVKNIADPLAKSLGLDLWDVRFLKEGTQWYLRIFIDKSEGVSIEDCERMSRLIDKPLDELDPISQSYCLEICSPGLERDLIRDEHFKKFIGSKIKIKLIRVNSKGEREIFGKLLKQDGNIISIDNGEKVIEVNKKDVANVKLDDFND